MARKPITVYQLNQYIKRSLETDPVMRDVAVTGEISRITFHKNGYVYFDLKDERSCVSCAIWKDIPGRDELDSGRQVTVYGRLSVYDVRGTYSIAVDAVEQAGEGELAIAFARLKKKLEAEGLFAESHKRPIPAFPKHVAVVTAPTGAAIRDILQIMTDRNDYVDIHLFPVAVQGPAAPAEIAAAIDRIDRDYPWMDVIIAGRGGGSEEDLAAFSEEIVARSIYACRIPIISAVGHESDIAISDFVADVRAATPTDAANIAVPDTRLLRDTMDRYLSRLKKELEAKVFYKEQQLAACGMDAMKQLLHSRVRIQEERADRLMERLEALDPLHTLQRGYAMVRGEDGQIRTEAASVHNNETIEVLMQDGSIRAVVNEVKAGDCHE